LSNSFGIWDTVTKLSLVWSGLVCAGDKSGDNPPSGSSCCFADSSNAVVGVGYFPERVHDGNAGQG